MRVCVFGAGSVGSHLAARLAATGVKLTVVARGRQLEAIRSGGITLNSNGQTFRTGPLPATDDAASLPKHDLIFVTLKAMSLPVVAKSLFNLAKDDAAIAFVVNGVPWWWSHGSAKEGPLYGLDPAAELWNLLRNHALGVSVLSANSLREPGVVDHAGANNWVVGEPDGRKSERLAETVSLLRRAGIAAEPTSEIREAVWRKLLINVAFNPIGALTCLHGSEISSDVQLREFALQMVEEATAVGRALGLRLGDIDRQEIVSGVGRAKGRPSSMLQDVIGHRPLEAEAIIGQVVRFGEQLGASVKTLSLVYGLLRGRSLALELRGN